MVVELPSIKTTSNIISDPGKTEDIVMKLEELKRVLEEMSPTYLPRYFDFSPPNFDKFNFPPSYKENTSIEKQCFKVVKNFNRQYKLEFPNRKALLLIPRNEVNVKKFVCTYICPVKWIYPEVYDWEGAASFVSDHLNFIALLPSTEIPRKIYSSTTILTLQLGNCFDFSILLCSLLIGVGYDAYVVSGYATRECCYVDLTRTQCPLLKEPEEKMPEIVTEPVSKYVVKPLKLFKSKYDMTELAKVIKTRKGEEAEQRKQDELAKLEAEKPKSDPLFGMRVHSWILVKAGQRDIKNDFFIESLTGQYFDLTTKMYLGIESLWNDKNYWVNKFCCLKGLEEMSFDLNDLFFWEPIIPIEHFSVLPKKPVHEEEEALPEDVCKTIDMPLTWIRNLNVDLKTFEIRFPGCQKQTNYNKVQQFQYSPYYCLSGLNTRLRIFDTRSMKNLVEVQEFYINREDRFYKSVIKDGWITEYFNEGNEYALKKHSYEKSKNSEENNRELEFYEDARVDGLIRRVETPISIEEIYKNRKDFLQYMFVSFEPRPENDNYYSYRNINYIIKKFGRNVTIKAEEDIAELTFQLDDEKIYIKYHIPDGSIIPNTREYIKPPPSNDGQNTLHLYPNTHRSFEASKFSVKKNNLQIYELLKKLLKAEKESIDDVRFCENDTRTIISYRVKAKMEDKISVSLYDTLRNEKAKAVRLDLSRDYQSKLLTKEIPLDFLDPYMQQHNLNEIRRKEEAYLVRESCLADLKLRLIKQADLIRARFDCETDRLQKKQTWYYQNKMMLSLEDEQVYLKYCADTVALLDTLENLLIRHQQTAPHKYMEMERRIRKDPRLVRFL